jgi:hypothetical protein
MSKRIALTIVAALSAPALSASAVQLLSNGNFESPVVVGDGNHIDTVPTGWSIDQGQFNLVRAGTNQFLDLTGPQGAPGTYVFQNFTLNALSNVTFGAQFSPRDGSVGSGGSTAIYGTNNTVQLATSPRVQNANAADTGFIPTQGLTSLPAGTYTFRAFIDDPANVDNAFVDASPVPEPASLGLATLAGATLLTRRRTRKA